jgi:type III pantothenate kinase
VIGGSTISSLQSGVYYGYVALVEGVLARMKKELGPAHVIATGGFAVMIAEDVDEINLVEENLTLFGLRSLFLRTNPAPGR